MNLTTQVTEKISQLPEEAQAALLVMANDWARKYEAPDTEANQYDEQLLELLEKRSQQAKANPEQLVDAIEFIRQRKQRYE